MAKSWERTNWAIHGDLRAQRGTKSGSLTDLLKVARVVIAKQMAQRRLIQFVQDITQLVIIITSLRKVS
jgi:hypothetical protein